MRESASSARADISGDPDLDAQAPTRAPDGSCIVFAGSVTERPGYTLGSGDLNWQPIQP